MKIGYARVSMHDQNLDLQRDALKAAGCKKIIEDTISGGKVRRDGLDRVLELLRKGDVLAVWRLDRLGRSLKHLIELMARAGGPGDRLPEHDRGHRHDHAGRQAGIPHLRGVGRVRAEPDPRADAGRAGSGEGTRQDRRAEIQAGGAATQAGR